MIVGGPLKKGHTNMMHCLKKRTYNITKDKKIYLSLDMTGQEGGTEHQVSSITEKDGVTAECGLLIGQ